MTEALHECVYDAITEEEFGGDPILATYIELALIEIDQKRPCFPNPLEEPLFWRRYFIPWVRDAVEEVRATRAAFEKAVLDTTGKGS